MFNWFSKNFKLKLYMKSGNVIQLDNVLSYELRNEGNEIVFIKLEQVHKGEHLLIKTIDLTQIEAVTKVS